MTTNNETTQTEPDTQTNNLPSKDVAAALGVSVRVIRNWHRRDGCPKNPDGTFNLPEVIQWREAHEEARQAKQNDLSALSSVAIGNLFGFTAQAVGAWYKRDGCPRNDDGTYNLADVIQWRDARIEARAEARQRTENPDGIDWTNERHKFSAKKLKLDYERRRGDLLDRETVERRERLLATLFKESLLGWPARIAPLLQGLEVGECEVRMIEEVDRLLGEMAAKLRR